MNNWCICWFSRIFLLGILIFKGLTERHLHKSFRVKGIMIIFTFAYTIFRCVILTNVLYTYRQNTTVVLDVVYLFISLRYTFRPLLGHHQALWRYIV
jgi:hypothetical protein